MSSAGQKLVAGRIPNERIATTRVTVDSPAFTAITVLATVVAPLVIGRIYKVRCEAHIGSDTVGDDVLCEVRENDVAGNQLQRSRLLVESTSGFGWPIALEGEHTAVATGNKTFVFTAMLSSGTGDLFLRAAGTRPTLLYVDYIRG